MTEAQFVRNHRGIDQGNDPAKELLEGMYRRIKVRAADTHAIAAAERDPLRLCFLWPGVPASPEVDKSPKNRSRYVHASEYSCSSPRRCVALSTDFLCRPPKSAWMKGTCTSRK